MLEDGDTFKGQGLVGCSYIIGNSATERDCCGFSGTIVGFQERAIVKDQAFPFPDVALASSPHQALLHVLLQRTYAEKMNTHQS